MQVKYVEFYMIIVLKMNTLKHMANINLGSIIVSCNAY